MYKKVGTIGTGSYGTVYKLLPRPLKDGNLLPVAAKRNIIHESINFVGSIRELDMLQRFNGHPHFVGLVDVVPGTTIPTTPTTGQMQKDDILFPVLEKYDTSLDRYIAEFSLEYDHVMHITMQLLVALEFAHARSVIHRDLKPSNVLVNRQGIRICLADFGISRVDNGEEHTPNITPNWYKAPEVMTRNYGVKADIWSLGCIVYELATGKLLIHTKTNDNIDELIREYRRIDNELESILQHVNPTIRKIINMCIQPVAERASATQILDTVFLSIHKLGPYIKLRRQDYPPRQLDYALITGINPESMVILSQIAENASRYAWFTPRIALHALDLSTRVIDEDVPVFLYTLHILYMCYKYYLTLAVPTSFETFSLPYLRTESEHKELLSSNGNAVESTILEAVNYEFYRPSFFRAFMEQKTPPTSMDVCALCGYMSEIFDGDAVFTADEIVRKYLEKTK